MKKRSQASLNPLAAGLLCGLMIFPARNASFLLMSRYYPPVELILSRGAEALGMILLLAAALLTAAMFSNSRLAGRKGRCALGGAIMILSIITLVMFDLYGCIFIHSYMTYCGPYLLESLMTDLYNSISDPATFILWLSIASVWCISRKRTISQILLFGMGCAITVILLTAAHCAVSLLTTWYMTNEARDIIEPSLAALAYMGCFFCGAWILEKARIQPV